MIENLVLIPPLTTDITLYTDKLIQVIIVTDIAVYLHKYCVNNVLYLMGLTKTLDNYAIVQVALNSCVVSSVFPTNIITRTGDWHSIQIVTLNGKVCKTLRLIVRTCIGGN